MSNVIDIVQKRPAAAPEARPAPYGADEAATPSSPFYGYQEARYSAPAVIPRALPLPVEIIGYWMNGTDLANHGPILRFWSYDVSCKLIAFVSWHALAQRPLEVFRSLKARGAPIRTLESDGMNLQLTEWAFELQFRALDARMLGGFNQVIVTPLPTGITPPDVMATLRPEVTAPQWLDALSTADVHTQFLHDLKREAAGGLLH